MLCAFQADVLLWRWSIVCYFGPRPVCHPQLEVVPKRAGWLVSFDFVTRRVIFKRIQKGNPLRKDFAGGMSGWSQWGIRVKAGGAPFSENPTPTLEGSTVMWLKLGGRKNILKKKIQAEKLKWPQSSKPRSTQLPWDSMWSVPLLTSLCYSRIS